MKLQRFELKEKLKSFFIYLLLELVIAFFISLVTNFIYNDILLCVGLIPAIIGCFSLYDANSAMIELNSLSQSKSPYFSEAKIALAKRENELLKLKSSFTGSILDLRLHSLELMLSGITLIILSIF
ncbi:hypothetical protein U729_3011 [Clostridium baratii str. Sullivan]|uniref:Uncharacterized protein n=1 Tax=Clostridium baratii str. Sullivan TaxID=1415775 RepID=A0A0A7FWJ4_9CLOT|nr:hypothetical protein [Clostridium baratii]AIY83948.1 hypothetical protein U729_3011 [Clostridium baratii str. Sullivan]